MIFRKKIKSVLAAQKVMQLSDEMHVYYFASIILTTIALESPVFLRGPDYFDEAIRLAKEGRTRLIDMKGIWPEGKSVLSYFDQMFDLQYKWVEHLKTYKDPPDLTGKNPAQFLENRFKKQYQIEDMKTACRERAASGLENAVPGVYSDYVRSDLQEYIEGELGQIFKRYGIPKALWEEHMS